MILVSKVRNLHNIMTLLFLIFYLFNFDFVLIHRFLYLQFSFFFLFWFFNIILSFPFWFWFLFLDESSRNVADAQPIRAWRTRTVVSLQPSPIELYDRYVVTYFWTLFFNARGFFFMVFLFLRFVVLYFSTVHCAAYRKPSSTTKKVYYYMADVSFILF